MKKGPVVLPIGAFLFLGLFSLARPATAAAPVQEKEDPGIEALLKKRAPLAKPDQEELARAIFRKLAEASDDAAPEFFERYYLLVMDKCPDTDRAHESYWRLTNLYERAYGEPRYEAIVKILEQFLSRYKTSNVLSLKKHPDEMLKFSPVGRLHQAYEALGRYDKIAAYYDRIASAEASFSLYDYFEFASALEETKRFKEAIVWYEKFLKKTEGNEDVDFMREMAADRIKELKK